MGRILEVAAYPCAWPIDWPRTSVNRRAKSRYTVSFADARDSLVRELKLFPSKEIVVSTNVPVRRDGLPYSGVSQPEDPAVAVYWVDSDGPHVVACDQWRSVRENLRAVGTTIEALRQLKRTGATQVLRRAYIGLTALAANNPKRTWREVFGLDASSRPTADDLKKRFRALTLERHPDRTGSDNEMIELKDAWDEAIREVGGK